VQWQSKITLSTKDYPYITYPPRGHQEKNASKAILNIIPSSDDKAQPAVSIRG
jgi:hypothetical protein